MRKLESILVASDLTEGSDEVVRAAASIAARTNARLHALHAFDFQALPYSEERLARVTFADRIDEAKRALREQVRRTSPPGVDVASEEVVIYIAHKAIRDRAEAVDADLIVMGPHRPLPVGDRFLGSTTDRVIRTVKAPCLIVRGALSLPLRRVLVPIDLSEPALAALDLALEWSDALGPDGKDAGAAPRLTVLHVIPPVLGREDAPFEHSVIGPELHREVNDAVERVDGTPSVEIREEVCWGTVPSDEILRVAEREDTDLVVLATHGHGAVRRALTGSVASAVARAADGPVLLVPPSMWSDEEAGRAR